MARILRIIDKDTGKLVAFTTTPADPRKTGCSKMEHPACPRAATESSATVRAQRLMGLAVRRTLERGGGVSDLLGITARMILLELVRKAKP